MRRGRASLALLVVAVMAFQLNDAQRAKVAWVPNPRAANGGWVSDAAHHLQPATVDSVNAMIGALERETSAEIGVAVVDSTAGLELQPFATALHRAWGVGKSGKDNGVLLLWDPVHRGVFISVGYGLEGAIPDRRAGRIRDEIVAHFRDSDFDGGIIAGVRAIANAAREEGGGQRQGITRGFASEHRGRNVLAWIGSLGGGLLALVGGLVGWRRWQRRGPRMCRNGHQMRLLSETADDATLDAGQKLEEKLGSVDWDVWICDTCGDVMRVAVPSWFSRYEACPQCSRKTVKTTRRTLVASTTITHGREEVTKTCANCGYRDVSTHDLPLVSSGGGSSGSGGGGGGGGGGFGGGSAGGGGAGGHY